eukprot:19625-Rhodomonas_salina.2
MAVSRPMLAPDPLYCHCLLGRFALWLCAYVAIRVPCCIALLQATGRTRCQRYSPTAWALAGFMIVTR